MRGGRIALVALALVAPACGLLAGFGPDKTLAGSDGGAGGHGGAVAVGGHGGLGGTSAGGGEGGEGGGGSLDFCEPDSDLVWLRTFGDASADFIEHLAPAPEDGIYASGLFNGAIDLGLGPMVSQGGRDYFVARFDASGQVVWADSFGTQADADHVPRLARHANGVVLAGNTSENVDVGDGGPRVPNQGQAAHVTMFSPTGSHLWTTWIDGPGGTYALSVAVDPTTGDVLLYGAFNLTLDLGGPLDLVSNGDNDAMLIRLDGDDGTVLDSRSWGGLDGDWARKVVVADDGRIFLAGSTIGDIDFGDGPELTLGGADSYAAVLTPDLEFVWARAYPEDGYQHFWDMALAPDGDMVAVGLIVNGSVDLGATGVFSGIVDAYFVRISGDDGHVVDGRLIPGIDYPKGIAVDASGDIVFAGEFDGALVLGSETFHSAGGAGDPVMFKLSPDFQQVKWRNVFVGNEGNEGFFDVIVLEDGHAIVGGYFRETFVADGCEPRPAAGDAEAVLLKRRP